MNEQANRIKNEVHIPFDFKIKLDEIYRSMYDNINRELKDQTNMLLFDKLMFKRFDVTVLRENLVAQHEAPIIRNDPNGGGD